MKVDAFFWWGMVIALVFIFFYIGVFIFLLFVVVRDFIHRNDKGCDCDNKTT